jgi:hypothetical protein
MGEASHFFYQIRKIHCVPYDGNKWCREDGIFILMGGGAKIQGNKVIILAKGGYGISSPFTSRSWIYVVFLFLCLGLFIIVQDFFEQGEVEEIRT